MARLIKFAFPIFSKSIEGPFWENRIIEGQRAAKELLEPIFWLGKMKGSNAEGVKLLDR